MHVYDKYFPEDKNPTDKWWGEGRGHFKTFTSLLEHLLLHDSISYKIIFISFEVGKNLCAESFEHTSSDTCQISAVWKDFYLTGR